ncbi:MAG: pentapeptide repeat-containing protein [Parvibaculum sp.]
MDDQQQRVNEEDSGEAAEGQRNLKPANSNPWYILATVHGEQDGEYFDKELHQKNRRTWNRWMSAALNEGTRTALIEKHGVDPGDLRPVAQHDLGEIEQLTAERLAFKELALPDPGNPGEPAVIDFELVDFAQHLISDGFVFPGKARFYGATFRNQARFDGATFSKGAAFDGATFRDVALFGGATFRNHAGFLGATFRGSTHFEGATFRDVVVFEDATFESSATFYGATFRDAALFAGATFRGVGFQYAIFMDRAVFGDATFRSATFDGATFRNEGAFHGASFTIRARFDRAIFRGGAWFSGATFKGSAGFGHVTFASTTSFDEARFGESPDFRDARFPFSTTWRRVPWPPPRRRTAASDVEHYASLRHAMDVAKRPDAELVFFVLEMQARRYTDIPLLQKLAINIHLGLADGGRSLGRPALAWLLAFVLAFLVEGVTLAPGVFAIPSPLAFEVMRLSLGSAIIIGAPMFDPRKLEQLRLSLPHLTGQPELPAGLSPLPDWLQLLGVAHAGFSALCLFLMALAIRNWLRLR